MSKYWDRRAGENMWEYMEDAEKTAKEINKLYRQGYSYLSKAIQDIYERFRDKHGLTEEEAKRLLAAMRDPSDIEELKRKLTDSQYAAERPQLLAMLESAAYQHRILRLKSVMKQVDAIMTGIYKQELYQATDSLRNLAEKVYYKSIYETQRQTGLAFSFDLVDPDAIDRALHSRWSGKNYSARIWDNTQELARSLKEELMVNLMTGRTNREAAEAIADKFGQGAYNSRRLVRTESCYLANQMEMESYKECEIEKYRYVATLDLRTSKTCRGLDGKVFPVSEQQPGKNCPPMHPFCRSTTICDISAEELARMKRIARNPETGRNEKVPADMTYQQWYDKYVKGRPEAEANEKMVQNRSSDRKQFERYREVLGKDAPETLDEFQQMKYTDNSKWEYTKGLKKYLSKYPTSDKRYYDAGEELRSSGITKSVVLPPVQKQAYILPEGKRDPYHIMHRMAERHITDDEVRSYMGKADVMLVQWGGRRQAFYGSDGVCVIAKSGEDWVYKTAWKKEDFDEDTEAILEVIRKHVKQ